MMNRSGRVPKQYLGAFKKGHRHSVREMIDEELSWTLLDKIVKSKYTDTKAMEELAYITKFYNEYYRNVIKKGDEKALHNTDELRKSCYSRTNARNRDLMSMHNRITEDSEEYVEYKLSILIRLRYILLVMTF